MANAVWFIFLAFYSSQFIIDMLGWHKYARKSITSTNSRKLCENQTVSLCLKLFVFLKVMWNKTIEIQSDDEVWQTLTDVSVRVQADISVVVFMA